MKLYQIAELVEIAKRKSPFYRNLYKDGATFSELPIVDEGQFWKANSYKNNRIITEPALHGILLRSGGTTGVPKVSVFSSAEWRTFCKIMSSKLEGARLLREGDRVANMFVYGSLYGSFLFVNDFLQECSHQMLQLPIGAGKGLDIEGSVLLLKELKANVVMSTPYLLVAIAAFVKANNIKGVNINRFLYGGDVFLESQYRFIKSIFPKAEISSSGYASTDAGFLGYADSTCQINEYRTDNQFTIMEIVDETGQVIEEENVRGRLIVTNLTKTLMPVIRYPVGDLAVWRESKNCKFRKLKLVGRHTKKDNLLTLGDRELAYQDVYEILKRSELCGNILGFQILLNKKIIIQIACDVENKRTLKSADSEIKGLLKDSIPGLDLRSVEIRFIDFFQLKYDSRTYKAIKTVKEHE